MVFLKKLFSENGEVSSKRISSIIILICLLIMAFIASIRSEYGLVPEYMFDALALLCGAGFGFGVIEKFRTKNSDDEIRD